MGGIWKKRLVRSIMFISSYFPLYVLLLITHSQSILGRLDAIINNSVSVFSLQNFDIVIVMFLLLLGGITVSIFSVVLLKRATACRFSAITNLHSPNDKVMNYVFTYILPILGITIDNPSTILVNILLFSLIWFLYVKLDLLFLNPLWVISGYISYEYDGGYLITNITFENLKRQNMLYGVYLANNIFLAHSKDNQ